MRVLDNIKADVEVPIPIVGAGNALESLVEKILTQKGYSSVLTTNYKHLKEPIELCIIVDSAYLDTSVVINKIKSAFPYSTLLILTTSKNNHDFNTFKGLGADYVLEFKQGLKELPIALVNVHV